MSAHRRRQRDGQAGQATVELAILLPLVALAVLAVVQVALVVRGQLVVTHAAREGVRAASRGSSDAAVTVAVVESGLDADRTSVDIDRTEADGHSLVTVTVRHELATDVPLVGLLIPDIALEDALTMRVE